MATDDHEQGPVPEHLLPAKKRRDLQRAAEAKYAHKRPATLARLRRLKIERDSLDRMVEINEERGGR